MAPSFHNKVYAMTKSDIIEMYQQEFADLEKDYVEGKITVDEYVKFKNNLEKACEDDLKDLR